MGMEEPGEMITFVSVIVGFNFMKESFPLKKKHLVVLASEKKISVILKNVHCSNIECPF